MSVSTTHQHSNICLLREDLFIIRAKIFTEKIVDISRLLKTTELNFLQITKQKNPSKNPPNPTEIKFY